MITDPHAKFYQIEKLGDTATAAQELPHRRARGIVWRSAARPKTRAKDSRQEIAQGD
jgi:hypothetical protein